MVDQGVFAVGSGPAYEPWKLWDTQRHRGPMHLVHAAILAANPHNSQPWLFKVSEDAIDVHADVRRNIGAIDPALREMYIGIGCALENLLIAATADGLAAHADLIPDPGNPTHAAKVRLARSEVAKSALYDAIARRHTNRGEYDLARPVPDDVFAQMAALGPDLAAVRVLWFRKDDERGHVGELVVAATEAIIGDRRQSADSAKWFRSNWHALQEHRDGITLDAQNLPPALNMAAKVLPELGQDAADGAWLRATRERHVATAAAFGLIAVSDAGDPASRIRGGRLWQRMHLWMTARGLAAQPLNQMSERADRERQLGIEPRFGNALKELVGGADLHALMPFRVGYPTQGASPSPRRELRSVIL